MVAAFPQKKESVALYAKVREDFGLELCWEFGVDLEQAV
jgi:hypothetical protein